MKLRSFQQLRYYQFDGLSEQPGVFQGLFTRRGGVSQGPFESLNLARSVGDDPAAVQENNWRMLSAFEVRPGQVVTAWLVHGRSVAAVTAADGGTFRRDTDAIITRDRGVTLTMRFADCVPIVFYDPVHGAIGLAHAGWRGVAAGIVPATLTALRSAYDCNPRDIWAGIGPCIGVERYRVGPEVIAAVAAACPPDAVIVQHQPDGSTHLDLNTAVAAQLQTCGVGQIEDSGLCTASNTAEWFSHRAEHGRTGRFGVVIGLSA